MNCSDCIHEEACLSLVPRTFWDSDFYKNCDHFKDKNKIIELPCKVGDTVYHFKDIYGGNGKRKKYEKTIIEHIIVDSFVIGDSGKLQINTCMTDRNEWRYYTDDDFGRYVYLSKADAENKLKGGKI